MFTSVLLAIAGAALQGSAGFAPPTSPPAPERQATAARAVRSPTLDGRDDDEVWRTAQPITDFHEFDPDEGKAPRFATVAKVAFDEHNLYVFVRAFDAEPHRIQKLLARRDAYTAADDIWIMVDSYHDRRTGYEFGVNPAGVKRDNAIYNDGNEDNSWDGVWDVATAVDSLGWTAEFRIPLSQLRYASTPTHTFGFMVIRDIVRFKERLSWPLLHRNQAGLPSQFGELVGIDGISSPRRLEATPYVVTKNVSVPTAAGFDRDQRLTAGADFKYGVTSNLTLDGTVNPDFGQVEADPSVLNLGAFETFFQERRPFFIEGAGLLSFDVNCNVVNCSGEGLFYSRRIGRSPELAGAYGDANSPTATTILGAAKLTGRLPRGLSVGVLDAVTQRQVGMLDRTIEPTTNYAVLRATQDLRHGETGIGLIFTGVNRSLDQWSRDSLRASADVVGLNLRHRFFKSRYQIQAAVTASRVTGTPAAIFVTDTDAVHYYQRPDGALPWDPMRTSLSGSTAQARFGKVAGFLQFETSYQRITPGYEINDLGFLNRADWQDQSTWASLNFQKPNAVFNRLFWNFNEWNDWTIARLPLEHAVNTNAHTELKNHWWLHAGGTVGQLGSAFCDRCARGGPAVRVDPYVAPWAGIEGDGRRVVVPYLWINYWRGDGGRSASLNLNPSADLRVANRWTANVGLSFTRNRNDTQWYRNFDDATGSTHYTFGHLEQRTMSLQLRLNYTASPNLSLQIYASPFVSKGAYTSVRELNDPRAQAYADRYRPYGDTAVTNNPGGFNFKQFRSNTVLRWEYLPGSTIYLVWTQGRDDSESEFGSRSFSGDFRQLFRRHPDNTFLIKVSHWFDW